MYVVVNAATSADGKLSNRAREQVVISGDADFDRVDALRADADAVAVGVGTVLADDPHLTLDRSERIDDRVARGESPHPARVVADSLARTPPDARILDDVARTFVLVSDAAPASRIDRLERSGTTVLAIEGERDDGRVDLPVALDELADHGIASIVVEGGGELLFSLFDAGLVDELTVFVGSVLIGGRDAPTLVDGDGWLADLVELELRDVERLDDGVLLNYVVEE